MTVLRKRPCRLPPKPSQATLTSRQKYVFCKRDTGSFLFWNGPDRVNMNGSCTSFCNQLSGDLKKRPVQNSGQEWLVRVDGKPPVLLCWGKEGKASSHNFLHTKLGPRAKEMVHLPFIGWVLIWKILSLVRALEASWLYIAWWLKAQVLKLTNLRSNFRLATY